MKHILRTIVCGIHFYIQSWVDQKINKKTNQKWCVTEIFLGHRFGDEISKSFDVCNKNSDYLPPTKWKLVISWTEGPEEAISERPWQQILLEKQPK